MVANARPSDDNSERDSPQGNTPPTGFAVAIQRQKGGRPRLEFDLGHVRTLGAYGASYQEMASALRTNKNTILERMQEKGDFFDAYQEGLSQTTLKLRHRQIQLAMAGDGRMLTWLGMQLLGQRNKTTEDKTVTNRQEIVFTIKQSPDEMSDGMSPPNLSADPEPEPMEVRRE